MAKNMVLVSIDKIVELYAQYILEMSIVNARLNLPLISQMDNGRLVSMLLL